ncbi:MAG: hypothetical protein ACI4KR_07455 [Ruminiclostridium sp.]
MKVITEKSGVKARSVNDRSIEHSISQKTELSKKDEREITGKAERAVHQADRNAPKAEMRNGKIPNRPPSAKHNSARSVSSQASSGETTSTTERKSEFEQQNIGAQAEISQHKPSGSKTTPTAKSEAVSPKMQNKPQTEIKTAETAAEKTAPTPLRPPKQYKLSENQPRNKSYKVLKNGTVDNGGITKKKERVIYSRRQKQKLKNAKPKKIDKPVNSPAERLSFSIPKPTANRKTHIINKIRRKKFRLKKVKRQQIWLSREQTTKLRNMLSAKKTAGGVANNKQQSASLRNMLAGKKTPGGVSKAAALIQKPMDTVKGAVLSQRPKTDKTEDSGTEAIKLGAQSADYLERGLKTAKNTGAKTAEKSAKLAKRVYRKFQKPTAAEAKRHLRKQVNRKLSGQVRKLTQRAVSKGAKAAAKTTAKTAKAAAKTAKQAAQAAQKAAQATARAVASAVTKIATFIASTMPYSLIIIGAILLIVILCLCMTEIIGGAGGSVAGGGAWLVDDSNNQTPEEIYEGYKKFIEQAKDVMETQAKDALQNEVTSFCSGDTAEPWRIIQYIDKNHNRLFYPASGADSTINDWIEEFGTDDYADYMSLLFVLMTREKQQAEGVSDGEIYDFDFTKEDFEEFMKTVNENSCRWGDTFVIKTAVETSPEYCPGQSCKRKTKQGCTCRSFTDDEGKVHTFCGGHPYCPKNHTKLTVQLYTVKDYYGKDYPEIYNFTDNEKVRYEASKAIIQGMIDYWEGGGGN